MNKHIKLYKSISKDVDKLNLLVTFDKEELLSIESLFEILF